MRIQPNRLSRLIVTLALGGTCLQFGGCGVADVGSFFANINPCGTILACDFRTFDFLTSGIDGPGVVPDKDPFCTLPPLCPQTVDPVFGGVGALP